MITKNYIAKGEGADRFEKVPVQIYEKPAAAVKAVADEIANLIRSKAAKGEKCVLGLATGSSPIKLYQELVRMHKEEGLSFKNVISFNLDEYMPMPKDSEHSYHYFMHHHLFDHIDIDPKNVHIPDGTLKNEEVDKFCREYEEQIEAAGGVDIQILGIGRTGHIGFNEPAEEFSKTTHCVDLSESTIEANARFFDSEDQVPRQAYTMGIQSIMQAKMILIMACGADKKEIVKKAFWGPICPQVPASVLQLHNNVILVGDEACLG